MNRIVWVMFAFALFLEGLGEASGYTSGPSDSLYGGNTDYWLPTPSSTYDYNSEYFNDDLHYAYLQGDLLLTTETWVPELYNTSSVEYKAINESVMNMVQQKLVEENLQDIFLHFGIIWMMPGDEGVKIEFVLIVKDNSSYSIEDAKEILNSINGFQDANIIVMTTPSTTLPYMDGSGYGSNNYSGSMATLILQGNLTLTTETWSSMLNDPASPEYQAINRSLTESVWTQAEILDYDKNLLMFSIIRMTSVPDNNGIRVEFLLVVIDYDMYNVTEEAENALNTIDGVEGATITGSMPFSDFNHSYTNYDWGDITNATHSSVWPSYDGSGFNYDYYDGNKQLLVLFGNFTLTTETWISQLSDQSSEEYKTIIQLLNNSVHEQAKIEGYTENLVSFEVSELKPDSTNNGLTVEFVIVVRDYDVMALYQDTEDALNAIDGVQDAVVTDSMPFTDIGHLFTVKEGSYTSGESGGYTTAPSDSYFGGSTDYWLPTPSSTYDYNYEYFNDDLHPVYLQGDLLLTTATWVPELNDSSSAEYKAINESLTNMVQQKVVEENLQDIILHFGVIWMMPGDAGVKIEFFLKVKDNGTYSIEDTKEALNSIEGIQDANIIDMTPPSTTWPYMDGSGYSSDYYGDSMTMLALFGNFTLTTETWKPQLSDQSSEEYQTISQSLNISVHSQAEIEGYTENLVLFSITRLLSHPTNNGLTVEFVIVARDYDVITLYQDTEDALNAIAGVQDAVVTDSMPFSEIAHLFTAYDGLAPSDITHSTVWPSFDGSGFSSNYYGGNMQSLAFFGNFTFTTETWVPQLSDQSSEEYQTISQSLNNLIHTQAEIEDLTENLVSFEIYGLMPSPTNNRVTVLFVIVVRGYDVNALHQDTEDALNAVPGIQDVVLSDSMPFSDIGHLFTSYDAYATSGGISQSSTLPSTDWSGLSTEYSSGYMEDMPGNLSVSFSTGIVTMGGFKKLALYCNSEAYAGFEYRVEWFADGESIGTSNHMTKDEFETYFVTSDDLSVPGFALEKSFECEVSVYHPDLTGPLLSLRSTHRRPVQFETTSFEIERGEDLTFSFNVDIPLTCIADNECYVDIKLVDPEEDNYCEDSGLSFKNMYTCGKRIFGSANNTESFGDTALTLTTRNNDNYELKSEFKFAITFESNSGVEDFWSGTFSQEFTVHVNDEKDFWKYSYCYSANDPTVCTLDGVCYRVNEIGDFTFYKNKQHKAEVQIATEYCDNGVCTCGVTIRAGKDVFLIDHCSNQHTTGFLNYTGEGNLYVTEKYNEYYEIWMPRGTLVTVAVSPLIWSPTTFINVVLYPSPNDMENVEGLCGSFNGDMSDDLTHADGSLTTFLDWWLWDDPVAFTVSWGVSGNDSLWNLLSNNIELDDLDEADTLCVCTGTSGQDSVLCSSHEKRMCVNDDTDEEIGVVRRSAERTRTKRRAERSVNSFLMDKGLLKRRLEIRNNRRVSMLHTRQKRETDSPSAEYVAAYAMCNASMYSECNSILDEEENNGANVTDKIRSCALDKMSNPSGPWDKSSCVVAANALEKRIEKTPSLSNGTSTVKVCPNLCSGNGVCNNGHCICNEGILKDDCSFNASRTTNVLNVDENCDASGKSCDSLSVMTDGIFEETKCKIVHRKITTPDFTEGSDNTYVENIELKNTYEGNCPLPSERRRRSTDDSDTNVAVNVYQVSVSNDGTTFSSSSRVVALDSTCLSYNSSGDNITVTLSSNFCLIGGTCYQDGTNKTGQTCSYCDVSIDPFSWTLHGDYCLIDDVCYINGSVKPGNECKFCNIAADNSDWTFDNETASCLETESDSESDGMQGYMIAIIVLIALLGLGGGGGVGGYFLWKKKIFRTKNSGLYDNVRRPMFSLRVEPTKDILPSYERKEHPPPNLYPQFPLPQPDSENIPDNLYTDRGKSNLNEAPQPVLPNTPHFDAETSPNQTTPTKED